MIYSLTFNNNNGIIIIQITHLKEEDKMKKALLITALAGTILLTGCGDNKSQDTYSATYADNSAGDYSETFTKAESGENDDASQINYKQSDVRTIDTKMLVYSCNMSIDVLEFDKSVDKIHELINNYNGFLESEVYSDGGNTSQWLYSEDEKWKTLNAVIRVPSAKYEDFCRDVEAVGDMRRKNASVENLSTEYSDLKTTLSIYEAKEKRYIELLSEISNEKDAIEVESELTNIQVEIARIKTRMNTIENDVAYSFVTLTINEVREYTDKPVVKKNDTFGQRLKNTVSDTWDKFLDFLEGALFVIIRLLPYLLLIGIIVFIISRIVKLISKINAKRAKNRPPKPVRNYPYPPMNPNMMNPNMIPPQVPDPRSVPVQGPPRPAAAQNNTPDTAAKDEKAPDKKTTDK